MEVNESEGINTTNILSAVQEVEDELTPGDEDREDEGLDDADQDGNYRDN